MGSLGKKLGDLRPAEVCLLSLDRCRELLPKDCELNDVALEHLRDGLYALAGMAVNGFLAGAAHSRLHLACEGKDPFSLSYGMREDFVCTSTSRLLMH